LSEFSQLDYRFMARALHLAEKGRFTARPNPMVGCVLVKDGEIVGEGWHRAPGEAHAEVHAIANAGGRAQGATAYVTLEPCCHYGRTGPCTEALIHAGVKKVICAIQDPFPQVSGQGIARLKPAGIEVSEGLLSQQAETLNRGFMTRHRTGRPFIRCKMAMSLDGRTAAADGSSQWITSPQARRDVQRLRAESGAIMTGIGTVLEDNPSLTVRGETEALQALIDQPYFQQPKRVVVDSRFRMPLDAKMLSLPGETWLFTLNPKDCATGRNLKVINSPSREARVDLNYVVDYLGSQHVNLLLVEAGPILCGGLLSAGLLDELVIYVAPKLLGDAGKGLLSLPGLQNIGQQVDLDISDIRAVGPDLRITAKLLERG
jgi:diaminohydroxyphosphoribosylaminopyrimidine deaminase/5-amino-6-(5-phosphoribosylamino)uracil reductase